MRIVGGMYKRRVLKAPKGQSTRPSAERLRESLFNICQLSIEGATFLDLFAGSGAVGLEAISRGAKEATLVESDKEAFGVIKQNIALLGCTGQVKPLFGDVLKVLSRIAKIVKPFDIIFADPPYLLPFEEGVLYSQKLLSFIEEHSLLAKGGLLFIEEGAPDLFSSIESIKLINCRRYGTSYLYQFEKESQ